MFNFIDEIPFYILIIAALTLGLTPFVPEPHIVEKIRMLFNGELKKAIDIFDLLMHSAPFVLLLIKLIRTLTAKL